MKIQIYDSIYEKSWVYTKALSYLFSPFFDDMSRYKDEFTEEPYQDSVELIAVEDDQVVGLLDIGIYTEEASHSYPYYPGKKMAYFANLAVHPDFQNQGIASQLFHSAWEQLHEKKVEALIIFTRDGEQANHLYQKWGGKLICQDYLVVGRPKDQIAFSFSVDNKQQTICLTDKSGNSLGYYQREGHYIVSRKEDLEHFEIDELYKEHTYVLKIE